MVYAPYTDAEMLNWSTKGHTDAIPDLVDRLTDLQTMLIKLHASLPKTSVADAEVYENTKKLMIETAHVSIVNALISVTAGQEGFKNMSNLPAYKTHKRTWNVVPTTNTIEYFKHPVTFADMFARKMTSSTVKHTSLNTPADVEKESIDDFAKIIDDTTETILKKHLTTTAVLVDHLRASQMVLYVNTAADNKNLFKDYSVIFKIARPVITTDMVTDVRQIDSTHFTIHKLNLGTTLLSAGYQEIVSPLSDVYIRAMVALATTVTTTGPPHRLVIDKAGAAETRAPVTRPCFHCNKPGHTQPNCPQASTPASTAIDAKLKVAYIESRDTLMTAHEAIILTLATLVEESDTDNEQDDEIYSPCVVSQNLPATPTRRPCLHTVCATKDHSVSFHDVFIGEFCTLCPTLRHVPSNHRATNLDLIFDGGPISWKSRRQDSVALSASETQNMVVNEVGKEILYLHVILRDVGYAQTPSTNIYEDNLACIAMSTNPVRRKSSRHIDIRVHFCHELYVPGVMKLIPLRTHLMVADTLTNSLPGPVLTQHREDVLGHTPFFARLLH
jgi:hypothetical protein